MKPSTTGGAKQSYRRITHSDTMHPMTARSSEDRALPDNEAGAITRDVAAYYARHPELKQSWKKTRHAIARNPTRRYP